jgi:DNA-binding beta-propeller fold protein YncE
MCPLSRQSQSLALVWKLALVAVSALFFLIVVAAQDSQPPKFTVTPLQLPDAKGLVTFDYFAYDSANRRLWVPAGNTGNVDVIDASTDHIRAIDGFPVARIVLRGQPLLVGPSSVAIGDGVVYVGNRADSKVCIIDARTLVLGDCIAFAAPSAGMASAPNGLLYVAATRELWATSGAPNIGAPAADPSIRIFSDSRPATLSSAHKISLPASAEDYAMDNLHGIFYTNLEEFGRTVAIDIHKRTVVSNWRSCDDSSGIAVDSRRGFVFVACGDHVIVLDGAHQGNVTGSIAAGPGIDDIDYSQDAGLLYVAAAEAGQLTIARIDDKGTPTVEATVPTAKGARSVVAGPDGSAYLIDPLEGRILKVERK